MIYVHLARWITNQWDVTSFVFTWQRTTPPHPSASRVARLSVRDVMAVGAAQICHSIWGPRLNVADKLLQSRSGRFRKVTRPRGSGGTMAERRRKWMWHDVVHQKLWTEWRDSLVRTFTLTLCCFIFSPCCFIWIHTAVVHGVSDAAVAGTTSTTQQTHSGDCWDALWSSLWQRKADVLIVTVSQLCLWRRVLGDWGCGGVRSLVCGTFRQIFYDENISDVSEQTPRLLSRHWNYE